MVTKKNSSDRHQWEKVFNTLVHILKTQQTQLDSLVKERKFLEERIQLQYDRYVSDAQLLEDQISQMKRDLSKAEMARLLEVAKSDMIVGLKQRESFVYKLRLENTESDLQDFKSCFDYLSYKCPEPRESSAVAEKENGGDGNPKSTKEDERRSKNLEGEVKKLKRAYEKLTSSKNSEVSALLSERDFVWNQFKKMESDYTSLLKSKRIEVAQANDKIKELVTSMEKLQSSNNEKDKTIVKLNTKLAELQADVDKSNREAASIRTRELELVRNSRSNFGTPLLNRCSTGLSSTTSSDNQKDSSRDTKKLRSRKESAKSQTSEDKKNPEKETRRSSKRKLVDADPSTETPRLFSSRFKVPKLKNSSSDIS